MIPFYEVVHWEKFQHYKADRPAWIKAYTAVLDKIEYRRLPDVSKAHLHGLWLLAARIGNRIPDDQEYLMAMLGANECVNVEILVSAGFLKPCTILHNPAEIAPQRREETDKIREEVEGEERREEKKNLKFNEYESGDRNLMVAPPRTIGAFLDGVSGAVEEREAEERLDTAQFLHGFFPPTRPGAGANPAVVRWVGRIPEHELQSSIEYFRSGTYLNDDGERVGWGSLKQDHCQRIITAGLNAILRERS